MSNSNKVGTKIPMLDERQEPALKQLNNQRMVYEQLYSIVACSRSDCTHLFSGLNSRCVRNIIVGTVANQH